MPLPSRSPGVWHSKHPAVWMQASENLLKLKSPGTGVACLCFWSGHQSRSQTGPPLATLSLWQRQSGFYKRSISAVNDAPPTAPSSPSAFSKAHPDEGAAFIPASPIIANRQALLFIKGAHQFCAGCLSAIGCVRAAPSPCVCPGTDKVHRAWL